MCRVPVQKTDILNDFFAHTPKLNACLDVAFTNLFIYA